MTVYVETNFVLEIVFSQEQSPACLKILALAERRQISLVLPAYCLLEPFETINRRHGARTELVSRLERELFQLERSAQFAEQVGPAGQLTSQLMTSSTEQERNAFDEFRPKLVAASEIVPLTGEIIHAGLGFERLHNLSVPDAIVYASIRSHLETVRPEKSCFINKNTRDFSDQDINRVLTQANCTMIPNFDHGHKYILSNLS